MEALNIGGTVMIILGLIFAIWAYIYDKKRHENRTN